MSTTYDPDDLRKAVQTRLDSLTKPRGSLGRLERIAMQFAMVRRNAMPSLSRKGMYIFCADHGVTDEGVSAYPQAVTRQMVANFAAGGAAINVLCRQRGIETFIVDVGIEGGSVPGAINSRVAGGTRNFAVERAMTRAEAERALAVGRELAEEAASSFDLVGLGEMGIGNTTTAAGLLAVFGGFDPGEIVGSGTGVTEETIRRKADVLRRAINLHRPDPTDPIGVLVAMGGFEFAAIAGFLTAASELGLPVVLDGFPGCAGALVACALKSDVREAVFFSHLSAERGHRAMLEALGAEPILSLDMRLGEGSGAALAIGIIESAVCLYREMATFDEACVSRDTGSATAVSQVR